MIGWSAISVWCEQSCFAFCFPSLSFSMTIKIMLGAKQADKFLVLEFFYSPSILRSHFFWWAQLWPCIRPCVKMVHFSYPPLLVFKPPSCTFFCPPFAYIFHSLTIPHPSAGKINTSWSKVGFGCLPTTILLGFFRGDLPHDHFIVKQYSNFALNTSTCSVFIINYIYVLSFSDYSTI